MHYSPKTTATHVRNSILTGNLSILSLYHTVSLYYTTVGNNQFVPLTLKVMFNELI